MRPRRWTRPRTTPTRRPDRAGRRLRRRPQGSGGPPGSSRAELLRHYYRHVAAEDIAERDRGRPVRRRDEPVQAGADRPQGTANVRVFTPTVDEHGWSAGGHTVVEVVTDDMPFLVDSVTMELNEQNRDVHMVMHPQILVRRDIDRRAPGGPHRRRPRRPDRPAARRLPRVVDAHRDRPRVRARGARGARAGPAQGAPRRPRGRRGLAARCTRRPRAHRRRPRRAPAAAARRGDRARGRRCCDWLADDHFTFLGYREYALESRSATTTCCAPCPAPGSASCAPTRTCRRRSASCRRWCKAQGPGEARCWCWPRPTRRPPCTGRSTSTTSA